MPRPPRPDDLYRLRVATQPRLLPGQPVVDTSNDVHIGRNEGTEDVVVIVTRLIPAGDGPRDGEPAPGFCGFDQNP